MTTQEELKIIVRKYRWVMEELTYSEKMVEWNQLSNGGARAMFGYLKVVLGSGRKVLVRVLGEAAKRGLTAYRAMPEKEALVAMAREHEELFDQVVSDEKDRESKELFASANAMYGYLKEKYGSSGEVLTALRWMIRNQRERRKTLAVLT